jgi:hypothetical protein
MDSRRSHQDYRQGQHRHLRSIGCGTMFTSPADRRRVLEPVLKPRVPAARRQYGASPRRRRPRYHFGTRDSSALQVIRPDHRSQRKRFKDKLLGFNRVPVDSEHGSHATEEPHGSRILRGRGRNYPVSRRLIGQGEKIGQDHPTESPTTVCPADPDSDLNITTDRLKARSADHTPVDLNNGQRYVGVAGLKSGRQDPSPW